MDDQPILSKGRWVYEWCETQHHLDAIEPTQALAIEYDSLGLAGLIVHTVEPRGTNPRPTAAQWCTASRVKSFESHGIRVVIGVGFRAPPYWEQLADAVIEAIAACKRSEFPCRGVNCDWEGSWDGHRAEARQLLQRVLAAHPDAALYLTMPSWWAPDTLPSGHATHPSAPTREWCDVIVQGPHPQLDPQTYGAPNLGASEGMLAWSRKQYLQYGFGASQIVPSVQMYHRSVEDHFTILLHEVTSAHWDRREADVSCLVALRVSKILVGRGFFGDGAVEKFQQSAGIKVDGRFGPASYKALMGSDAPADVRWFG